MKIQFDIRDYYWQLLVALFILLAVFVPHSFFIFDKWCFLNWANYIHQHGIGQIYTYSEYNYPPIIAYPLSLAGSFWDSPEKMDKYFYYFKLLTLIFDFAAVILITHWLGSKSKGPLYLLLTLANPLFLYNTYCWGQVDGVLSALVLLAVFATMVDKPWLMAVALVLAINFKAQSIIFFPVVGLLILYKLLAGKWSIKQITIALVSAIALQVLIILPFIITGQVGQMFKVITQSVDFFPYVSMNAYNIWHLLPIGASPIMVIDSGTFLVGLSYKQWGLFMFCLASFLILFPVFYGIVASKLKGIAYNLSTEVVLLMCAGIPLMFFFFNTQMHERYSHPAIIFFTAYAVYTRRWALFAIMLLAYGLNMEGVLHFFHFPNYGIALFTPTFVASIYTLLIALYAYTYYKALHSQHEQQLT